MTNILNLIQIYAALYNVDPLLVKSVIRVESNFNQHAIGTKGEVGLMQLMPQYFHGNIRDPRVNIQKGVKFLGHIKKECGHLGELNWVICFNRGVTGGLKHSNPATDDYVRKVSHYYREYQRENSKWVSSNI